MSLLLAILIFIVVFYFIITEKVPNAFATMLGGLIMVLVNIIDQEEAISAISERLDIILLLAGMMIVVSILSETGVFQWVAVKIAQSVKGEPFLIIVLLTLLTAVCSAFLDNVTTILLVTPISMFLATKLRLNPFPFIISNIMAANIGGSATLIGDPTQLIIGGEGDLSFNEFLFNTAPVSVLAILALLLTVYLIYGKELKSSNDLKEKIMHLDTSSYLKDIKLLKESGVIFLMILLGFISNNFTHEGVMTIAVTGAMILCIITKQKPEDIFKKVEWSTLFFFMGLFVMVKGIEKVHLIDMIGSEIVSITKNDLKTSVLGVTWISALLTSIIGNVTNAAAMSKVVEVIIPTFKDLHTQVFWWSLSLGSCLGGNFSILASATNVVGIEVAKKEGYNISFIKFLKFGTIITIQTMLIGSIYIWMRYL